MLDTQSRGGPRESTAIVQAQTIHQPCRNAAVGVLPENVAFAIAIEISMESGEVGLSAIKARYTIERRGHGHTAVAAIRITGPSDEEGPRCRCGGQSNNLPRTEWSAA